MVNFQEINVARRVIEQMLQWPRPEKWCFEGVGHDQNDSAAASASAACPATETFGHIRAMR